MREEVLKWRKTLMGLSALWIWLFHCFAYFCEGTFIERVEREIVQPGFCGVDIFLFLSGLGLTISFSNSKLIAFYYKRIKRVYIPFVIMTIVVACMLKWIPLDFFKVITGYCFYMVDIYTFLWFVPAIMTLYLFFPLLYILFERCRKKTVLFIVLLLCWYGLTMLAKGHLRGDLYGFTNRIPIFITGTYFGVITKERDWPWKNIFYIPLFLMLAAGKVLSYLSINEDLYLLVPVSDCCVPNFLMTISLVFLLSHWFERIDEKFPGNVLHRGFHGTIGLYGLISLEIYCVQEFLLKTYGWVFELHFGMVGSRLVLFALSTLCGLVLWFVSKKIGDLLDFLFGKRLIKA